MKKLQNYLMKPDELRKKLDNPKFRNEFREWSKSNLSVSKKSKSPSEPHQKSLQINLKKSVSLSNKENIRQNKQNKSTMQGSRHALRPTHELSQARYNSCTALDYHRPERTIKYSYRTKQGQQITNPNKTNQDSLIIKTNISESNATLFAVADGHGLYGHLVSQHIAKNLAKMYESACKHTRLSECIPKVFDRMQKSLSNSEINVSCSGSTLVNVMLENDEVICANVGDSRAILARQIDKKSWEMIYLSQDHKPSVESEKKRILKFGGKVHAFTDENNNAVGPLRVWLPNQKMQGLAMTRSFGDNVSKSVGVTHEPEIIRVKLNVKDRFLLLASDGVWEFITSQEVLQLIVPFYRENKLEEACDALLQLAYERWTVEDNSVVDDITFILIFFRNENYV